MNGLTRAIGDPPRRGPDDRARGAARSRRSRPVAASARSASTRSSSAGSGPARCPTCSSASGRPASSPRWPTVPRSGGCRGSRCSPALLDRGRRRPARRAAADGDRSPGDRAARVADGLRRRDDRGDDRVDDGRRPCSTRARRSGSSRCAPARRSPAASSGTLLVRAGGPRGRHARRSSSSRRSCSSSSGSLVVGVSRTTTVRVPTAAQRPVDRRRPAGGLRRGRPLAAHATRRDRLRPAGDPRCSR